MGNGSFQLLKDGGNCIIKEEVSELDSTAGGLLNLGFKYVESGMAQGQSNDKLA